MAVCECPEEWSGNVCEALATCGDGFVREGVEECDDGNMSNTDECLADCTLASCGDGFVHDGVEDCEPTSLNHGLEPELNGATCESVGLEPGPLLCGEGCVFDVQGCGVSDDMVVVPGGEFEMGSNTEPDEEPIRQMWVDTYWMDRTEVTVGAYEACVDEGACSEPSTGPNCNWAQGGPVAGFEAHPVNCVDWSQAEDYCAWAGGGTKRLPTEAEWEKAARGTDGRTYSWGDMPEPSCSHVVMNDVAAGGSGCGMGSTWVVGSKPQGTSPYGAQDMAGNMWEWVADWYGAYGVGETNNPMGPPMGNGRVLRGGSWNNYNSNNFRAANRYGIFFPTVDIYAVGMRCARTPPEAP